MKHLASDPLSVALAIGVLLASPALADEARLVVRPAEIEVGPGTELVVSASLVRGETVERAEPWAFRFEADAGVLRGNIYRAPDVAGRYVVRVFHPSSGQRAEAVVSVPLPRPAASFTIERPETPLAPGDRVVLRAVARGEGGDAMEVRPLWRVDRGRIDGQGSFQAPVEGGPCVVTALGPGTLRATLRLEVARPAPAAELRLEPSGLEVEPGRRVTLSMKKKAAEGTSVVPPWRIQWTISDGRIDGNVWTAPAEPGEYTILAQSDEGRAEARFTIRRLVGPLARIRIVPESIELLPGQLHEFEAIGEADDGTRVEFEPVWRSTGGKIDAAGRFEAPATPGEVEIGVADPATRLTARATVRVALPAPATLALAPDRAALRPGETVRFEARALDAEGRPASIDVEWKATGGSVDGGGTFVAGEAYGGEFQVVARDRRTGLSATAAVKVEPWPAARLVVEPGSPRVQPGEVVRFRARALDGSGREVPGAWRFRTSAGAIDAEGVLRAPDAPGDLDVTIVEAGSGKETTVRVVVLPRPAVGLEVRPATARLAPGEVATFQARLVDAAGRDVAGRFVWKAAGGTIDASGRFQAGKEPGASYEVVARDEATGLEGRSTVEIVAPDVWAIRLEPKSPAVEAGGSIAIAPVLEKNGAVVSALLAAFEFSTDAPARVGPDGRFAAPAQAGRYAVRVRHKATGATGTVEVEVRAPQPVRIAIEPASVELKAGQSVRFVARAFDAAGRVLPLPLEFRAEGGEIAADGTYRAGEAPGERFRVHAYLREPNLVASADVKIVAIDYRVELTPARVVVGPGDTVTFQSILTSDGKRVYAWPWSFKYQSEAGRFQENVYRAPEKAGTYEVRVEHERGSAKAEVVVRSGPVARVEVRPERATLAAGETETFSAKGFDAQGNEVEGKFTWRAAGGQIDAAGVFRAGTSPGRSFEVVATLPGSTVQGKATVEVKATESKYRLEVSADRAEVAPGEIVELGVKLFRDDAALEFWPWEVEYQAPAGTFRGHRFVAPDRPGSYEIRVKHPKAESRVVVVVRPVVEVAKLAIEPAAATLAPGAQQRFEVVATNERGEKVRAAVRWLAYGGEIDAGGLYRAPAEMGTYLVAAHVPGTKLEAVARIHVVRPDAVRLVVQPEEATVRPGERVDLRVSLWEGDRERMVWPWDLEYRPESGRIEEGVWVAPAAAGTYRVEISHPRARTTARFTVKAPAVGRIEIAPADVRLAPGETQDFRATCLNEAGAPVEAKVRWEATGGSIDDSGRFTAGPEGGRFVVKAVEAESGLTSQVEVVVWVETRYLGLGRRWGEQIQRGKRVQNDLINYVIANIFFRSAGEIADFRNGFVEGHGDGGDAVYQAAWQTVLFEFGRYYGREYRRQTIGLDETARFVAKQVLPLSPAELESFQKGFVAGHTLRSAAEDFDRILRRARQ